MKMEKEIKKLIKNIEIKKAGILLRNGKKDIDIFCKNIKILKYILENKKFTFYMEDNNKLVYYKFINLKKIKIDIELNFNYIFENFSNEFENFNFKNYLELEKKSVIKLNLLRYILLLRNDKINYILKNFKYIEKNKLFNKYLKNKIFKNELTKNNIIGILNKKPLNLIKILKFKYFTFYYIKKLNKNIKIIIKRLFKNNIYAFVGYDGSGKTTIINILKKQFKVKSVYMGVKQFTNRFYYKILGKNNFLKLIRLFAVYFEFVLLYFKIFFYSIKYEFVFLDRHPKLEIFKNKKITKKFINLIFFFYPNPKKYFILWNEPNIILKRKKERTEKEILILNKEIKKFNDKKIILIKNNTINETLNKINKIISQ